MNITTPHLTYICGQFTFNDSLGFVNQTSLSCFTVANSIPTDPVITSPVEGITYSFYDDLQFNYLSTDADIEQITYYIYINDTLNITTNTNISSWNSSNGAYQLKISGTDSYNFSSNTTVNFIVNAPPVSATANILPVTAYNNDTLVGYGQTTDYDGHNLNYSWRWYRNDVLILSGINDDSLTSGTNNEISTISSSYLTVYDSFIFSYIPNDGYDNGTWINSSAKTITNRVLRDLTVYYPPTGLISSEQLNVNYSIVDEDENINCTLGVNGTATFTANQNPSSGNASIYAVTFPTDGSHNYNISCVSEGDTTPVETGIRYYIYDTTAPTITGFVDDSSSIFPEIGDTITMNVTVSDQNNVTLCKLQMNDTKVWENKTTFVIHQPTNLTMMQYTIQPYSTANQSYIGWSVWCNDTAGNSGVSAPQVFKVQDTTQPNVTISLSGMNFENDSITSSKFYNLTYNVTFIDDNLFQIEINLSCDISGTVYYFQILDYNNTEFNKADTMDISNLPSQRCTWLASASDDHTAKKIKDYNVNKKSKGLEFETNEGNIVIIESNDGSKIQDTTHNKELDRHTFKFKFKEKTVSRSFDVKSESGKIYYRPNSYYLGHFVIWNEETKKGNWLDFVIKNKKLNKNDYTVTKINDYHYTVDINVGEELDEYEFQSIGGTNVYNTTIYTYIGSAIYVNTSNVYDNTTFNNFNVTVETTDAFPVFNSTPIEFTGQNGWIVNITNGTYILHFTDNDDQFIDYDYPMTITTDIEKAQQYSSSQSIVNVRIRNIKSLDYLTNYTIEMTNTNTSTIQTLFSGDTTTVTFYQNSTTYSLDASVDDYDNQTYDFTTTYQQNLTITLDMTILAFFTFYDETTLELFNLTSADSIDFVFFCTDSTITTRINLSSSNFTIPITCPYLRFRILLDYTTNGISIYDTYYRTYVIPPEELFNTSFYLIDLSTTSAVFNDLKADDLLNDYNNPSIHVYKIVEDEQIQITSDFTDIESKIGAYLVQNHEYIIEIHSDNNPDRIIGRYIAVTAGEKIIRLYDVGVYPQDSSSRFNNIEINSWYNETTDTVYFMYNDDGNETNSVVVEIFQNASTTGLTPLFSYTSTNEAAFELLYTNATLQNTTVTVKARLNLDSGIKNYAKTIQNYIAPILRGLFSHLGDNDDSRQNFFNMFITLFLGLLAIMATIRTANITSIVLIVIASLFVMFGLYGLSWAVIGLAGMVSFLSFLQEQGKN